MVNNSTSPEQKKKNFVKSNIAFKSFERVFLLIIKINIKISLEEIDLIPSESSIILIIVRILLTIQHYSANQITKKKSKFSRCFTVRDANPLSIKFWCIIFKIKILIFKI